MADAFIPVNDADLRRSGQRTWIASAAVGPHLHKMSFFADSRYADMTRNGTMQIERAGTGGNAVSIMASLSSAPPANTWSAPNRPIDGC